MGNKLNEPAVSSQSRQTTSVRDGHLPRSDNPIKIIPISQIFSEESCSPHFPPMEVHLHWSLLRDNSLHSEQLNHYDPVRSTMFSVQRNHCTRCSKGNSVRLTGWCWRWTWAEDREETPVSFMFRGSKSRAWDKMDEDGCIFTAERFHSVYSKVLIFMVFNDAQQHLHMGVY